jgi:hypothetical protein
MTMPIRQHAVACLAAVAFATPLAGAAQGPVEPSRADQLRVFIDCSYYCDMDYLRTEITWIDYMRDRADAQVHVLVSRQTTGGGGAEYTLDFIGLRQFEGRADTLRWVSGADASSDIIRRGLARTIKLGLVPFVATTPLAQHLDVAFTTPPHPAGAPPAPGAPQHDPWNFWTFRIAMNGNGSGETQTRFSYISGNLSANRTTEDWKLSINASGSYNESVFEYEIDGDLRRTTSIRRNYGTNTLIVRSLGPNLSAGFRAGASTSTFGNTALAFNFAPAIEYNFVPYAESTRRQFRVQYSAGMRYFDYREVTIFGENEELRPSHNLSFGYFTRQPWGSVNMGIDLSQYLHDASKYNAGISGSTDLRLFRGFSFNLGGSYARVRDQLSLPGRDLTAEEILLRQRQLATGYSYFAYGGISYRFGSIFNNVVNPRFVASGGGMMIIE